MHSGSTFPVAATVDATETALLLLVRLAADHEARSLICVAVVEVAGLDERAGRRYGRGDDRAGGRPGMTALEEPTFHLGRITHVLVSGQLLCLPDPCNECGEPLGCADPAVHGMITIIDADLYTTP
jgi:hypothetical protein